MKVLDVGCGPGILSMQLADSGFTVTGVDFSEEMLRHARENSEANDLDIRFINADATDLPFDDGEFDAVVSGYMLWTVSDPAAVISEWYRVLRPGGRLVYVDGDWMHDSRMTPMRMRLSSWASRIDDPDRKEEDDDGGIMGSLWSSEQSRPGDDLKMLRQCGFVNISVRTGIQKKVLHGIRYLAHGLTNNHFMISAEKETQI